MDPQEVRCVIIQTEIPLHKRQNAWTSWVFVFKIEEIQMLTYFYVKGDYSLKFLADWVVSSS